MSEKKENNFGLYRFIRAFVKPLVKLLWPTKVVNKENFKKVDNCIIICNHYSKLDGIIIMEEFLPKEAHFISKSELFENSSSGNFLSKMGSIPIKRGEADIEAVKNILKVLKDKKTLLIFPEGTRNKSGSHVLQPLKEGTARFAIKTKTAIVPMIYYNCPKVCKKNYLYVGEPFTLEEFYETSKKEGFDKANDFVTMKMEETRELVNKYVEEK